MKNKQLKKVKKILNGGYFVTSVPEENEEVYLMKIPNIEVRGGDLAYVNAVQISGNYKGSFRYINEEKTVIHFKEIYLIAPDVIH